MLPRLFLLWLVSEAGQTPSGVWGGLEMAPSPLDKQIIVKTAGYTVNHHTTGS